MIATKLDTSKIIQVPLDKSQYFQEEATKKQIYLHHTAGGGNARAVSQFWNSNETRIATAFIIANNGEIVQCFSSKHWAWHLGIDAEDFAKNGAPYQNLNKSSVGIEICNFGMLKYRNGKYYNYTGGIVDSKNVTTLEQPYKGYLHWEKYTDAQIESTRQLLVYLCDTYKIPKAYRSEIFQIDKEAFKGTAGIFTHNSVRKDKSDIYPCPRMIQMLKNL